MQSCALLKQYVTLLCAKAIVAAESMTEKVEVMTKELDKSLVVLRENVYRKGKL